MNAPNPYREAVLDFLWSLWGEMGLRSVIRNHPTVVADPEPLIIITAWFADYDLRLKEEVLRWSARNANWISKARLRQLFASLDEAWQGRMAALSSAVRSHNSQVQWPGSQSGAQAPKQLLSGKLSEKKDPLPFQNPSMLRFRLRAIVGVGARADVLTHLLLASTDFHSLPDFAYLKYTKSTFVPLLKELFEAGQLDRWKVQGSYRYRLRQPQLWAELLQLSNVQLLDLMAVARVLRQLDTIPLLETKPQRVAQVEATKLWQSLMNDLRSLGQPCLDGPVDLPELTQRAASLAVHWSKQRFAQQ